MAPIRRTIKNMVHNYTDAQVKVREATSNDPWGPSSTLMSEIADLTYNVMAFTEIMQMIWKRLNDHGKNWRHVYKAMVLLDYIVKTGSEKVAQQCKENIYSIQTLKDFQYMEENKDMGINVREKAKQLVALLKDDERLKNERAKALKAKERFAQSTVVSMYGRGATSPTSEGYSESQPSESYMPRSDSAPTSLNHDSNPEIEAVRPSTVGEEELQLQLALAMSKEEHDEDQRKKNRDDAKLQMAIEESKKEKETQSPPKQQNKETLLELLGNQPGGGEAAAQNDPWSSTTVPQNDPWGASQPPPPMAVAATASNDPWTGSSSNASATNQPQSFVANDPWAANPSSNSSEPWSSPPSQTNGTVGLNNHKPPVPAGLDEAFDMIGTRSKSPNTGTEEYANLPGAAFDMSGMQQSLEPQPAGGMLMPNNTDVMNNSKSPESFLGPNAGLVNLDNLVTKPTTPVAGPFTAATVDFATACMNAQNGSPNPNSNPFGSNSNTVNPFGPVSQANRVPLNQMPTSNTVPAMEFGQPGVPSQPYTMGAPMLQPMPAMGTMGAMGAMPPMGTMPVGNGNVQPANPFL